MKPLQRLNNTERGKLLADLFPEHKEPITKAIIADWDNFQANMQHMQDTWEPNPILTFDSWRNLTEEAAKRCKENDRIVKSNAVFSDQLFEGWLSMYTCQLIAHYAASEEVTDKNFKSMVDILFRNGQ